MMPLIKHVFHQTESIITFSIKKGCPQSPLARKHRRWCIWATTDVSIPSPAPPWRGWPASSRGQPHAAQRRAAWAWG